MAARVELRRPDPSDRETFLRWTRDPDLQLWLAPPGATHGADPENDVDRFLARPGSFAIHKLPSGRLIGTASLDAGDDPAEAELGICIGEQSDRGRGLGSAAVAALVHHGFGELGLRRIHLGTYSANVRAIAAFERAGFRTYERVPRAVHRAGEWWDAIMMELTAETRPGPRRPPG